MRLARFSFERFGTDEFIETREFRIKAVRDLGTLPNFGK
jgi:hypothetical protein